MRRSQLRAWIPAPLRHGANAILGANLVFKGPYPDFESAMAATRGYDDPGILAAVAAATRRVLDGDARYEQDGRSFATEPPPSHALEALLLGACRNGGELSVLDFGGSLGSHFLRWRPLLQCLPRLHWCVVEQPGFVDAGRALFAGQAQVSFQPSIAAARAHSPNAILASSVLQYLPDPETALRELSDCDAEVLVIDRLPVLTQGATVALTQHVPRRQGGSSYALRAFEPGFLRNQLAPRYQLVCEFPADDAELRVRGIRARYRGFVWRRAN